MAPVNKSGKLGKGKSKSVSQNARGFERAPPADEVRRDSESSDDFLERIVRTLNGDIQGLSALHVACLEGQLSSLKLMLDSGQWWINSSDDAQGRRPLHMFLSFQRSPRALACLRYLLRQGADVNLTSETGQTPLHMAVAEGLMDYTKILVEAGADLFAKDNSGLTPLDMARMWNHRKIGRYLKDCMWRDKNNKELRARKQTQTLYCEFMDCDRQDKIKKKPKIDRNVAQWANKKGITLQKEFCPKVLVSQFHKQCLVSDIMCPDIKPKKSDGKTSPKDPEDLPQEDNSATLDSPPQSPPKSPLESPSKSPPESPPESPLESPLGQMEEEVESEKKVTFKLPPITKLKPWVIYTAPEPDSHLVEPDLRGKVKLWRDTSSSKPHYKSKWDRTPREAPSLPVDTIQRVFFPRNFPPRIKARYNFKPKDIEDVQHKAYPQERTTIPWTEVAMHLSEGPRY